MAQCAKKGTQNVCNLTDSVSCLCTEGVSSSSGGNVGISSKLTRAEVEDEFTISLWSYSQTPPILVSVMSGAPKINEVVLEENRRKNCRIAQSSSL